MTRYLVGVDVGGTFTDIFALDRASGRVSTAKVPTTIDDQSRGFVDGVATLVPDFSEIGTIVHGTTTGTNALLERKVARAGIITTEGFRDVLEMRRRDRPHTWGLRGHFAPLIPRDRRLETPERVLANGHILIEVDQHDVQDKARALIGMGCEAVCLFSINGYANDENEQKMAEAVRLVWPTPYVTVATEILPEIREFERLSTAAINACLQPVVSAYVNRLDLALGARGFGGDLLIVQSNGGVMSVATARAQPVRTALSGPAAGVIAARAIARASGFADVITCDMGGTSFDVSLITGGEAALSAESSVDFGQVIRLPMIEITTIGAGGGSIASVDAGGLLQVGPESAGSNPGPVCYGLGNDRPTVTDANLVLGRINPDRPIGALPRLDVPAARAALARLGEALGLGPEDTAEAVLRVANAKMAGAIRLVSIERGHDPARFAAMPFGGGGALHTGALMQEVGLAAAIVPRFPGVTSALGCVVADMRHDRVQTVNAALDSLDLDALHAAMAEDASHLSGILDKAGVVFDGIAEVFELDMLYQGQTHTVPVALPGPRPTRQDIASAFEQAYRAAYGRLLDGVPMRVMNLRVACIGRRPELNMSAFAPDPGLPADRCRIATRPVRAGGRDHEVPVYDRLALGVGERVSGPCLLEQPDTTIFVDPGLVGEVDRHGNLIIRRA